MKKTSIFIISLVTALFSFGQNKDVKFQDDFSSNNQEWTSTSEMYIEGGSYHIYSNEIGRLSMKIFDVPKGFMEVKTKYESGLTNQGFGVFFRAKDTNNGYLFLIAGAGYYHVGVLKEGNFTKLQAWTQSSKVNVNGSNTLKVAYTKNSFTCYINGNEVFSAIDSKLQSGSFGLYSAKGVHASFDDLIIWTE